MIILADTGLSRPRGRSIPLETPPARRLEQPDADRNRVFDADPDHSPEENRSSRHGLCPSRLAFTVTAFKLLIQWHGLHPDPDGLILLSIAEFYL